MHTHYVTEPYVINASIKCNQSNYINYIIVYRPYFLK